MKPDQLLQLLFTNRDLIQQNNTHAAEHLQMLNKDYGKTTNEEVMINLELNNSLAELHFYSQYKKTIENSLKVVLKFKDSEYRNAVAQHYCLIGKCYATIGKYVDAQKYLLLTLLNLDSEQYNYALVKSEALLALAINEETAGNNHQKAIQYLEDALQLLQNTEYDIRKAICQMGLGNVYVNKGETELALQYYLEATEIFEQAFDLPNMGSAYCNIATCYITQKNYPKAEQYLKQSIDLRAKFGSPEDLCISYFNMASVLNETDRLDEAMDYLLRSKEILISTGNSFHLAETEEMLQEVTQKKQKGSGLSCSSAL